MTGCTSVCGNGLVEPDEGCDDNNTAPADGCSAQCMVEAGWSCDGSPSVCAIVECGDDVAAGEEPCDGTDLNEQTCESLGWHGGTLACSEDCVLDQSSCEATGRCGDDQLQPGFEACDGDSLGGITCESLGWHGGEAVCTEVCELDLSACEATGRCGDGVIQAEHEICDGSVPAGVTCATQGLFSGTVTCGDDCQYDLSSCNEAVALTSGDRHVCAVDMAGAAWCWGEGQFGKLGNGAEAIAYTPTPVTMPAGVSFSTISAGTSNTCALDTTGAAWCWGHGVSGKNGNGQATNKLVPSPVTMPTGRTFVSLATGSLHSCAIDDQGAGWCWGDGSNGKLGNGMASPVMVPALVEMNSAVSFTAISAGYGHTCAIDPAGRGWCWGLNSFGQLGNGNTNPSMLPAPVNQPGGSLFIDIRAGYMTTCAVTENGTSFCWGKGNAGQIGDSQMQDRLVPTAVSNSMDEVFIDVHSTHACSVSDSSLLRCWGNNEFGQLGRAGSYSTTPTMVSGNLSARVVATSQFGACAIVNSGRLWCWGMNDYGQLGVGSAFGTGFSAVPLPVVSP